MNNQRFKLKKKITINRMIKKMIKLLIMSKKKQMKQLKQKQKTPWIKLMTNKKRLINHLINNYQYKKRTNNNKNLSQNNKKNKDYLRRKRNLIYSLNVKVKLKLNFILNLNNKFLRILLSSLMRSQLQII